MEQHQATPASTDIKQQLSSTALPARPDIGVDRRVLQLVYPLPLIVGPKPPVVRIPGVVSAVQCEELRSIANQHFETGNKWGNFLDFTYITVSEAKWLYDAITHEFMKNNPWELSISGVYEQFRAIRYPTGRGQRWHTDFDVEDNDPSKLGFVLGISDPSEYEGGELCVGRERVKIQQGEVAIFPGYIMHSVSEVTAGQRYVAAGWASGPAFR
jgi:hypothetical protein